MKQWNWKLTAALAILGFTAGLCWPQTAQYAKPDRKLTPGVIDATIEADLSKKSYIVNGVEHNICAPDFVTPPFRVATKSEAVKTRVCRAYGITSGCPGRDWELDDAVPVELGGKNVEANLWPQPIKEARVKDHKVEDLLGGPRGLVCQGKITLKAAQACVLDDWVKCMDVVAELKAARIAGVSVNECLWLRLWPPAPYARAVSTRPCGGAVRVGTVVSATLKAVK